MGINKVSVINYVLFICKLNKSSLLCLLSLNPLSICLDFWSSILISISSTQLANAYQWPRDREKSWLSGCPWYILNRPWSLSCLTLANTLTVSPTIRHVNWSLRLWYFCLLPLTILKSHESQGPVLLTPESLDRKGRISQLCRVLFAKRAGQKVPKQPVAKFRKLQWLVGSEGYHSLLESCCLGLSWELGLQGRVKSQTGTITKISTEK
jgi:hypothetical protein